MTLAYLAYTATALEWAWTLTGTICLAVCILSLWQAALDVPANQDEVERWTTAWMFVAGEIERVLAQSLMLIFGIVAMSTAPANPEAPPTTLTIVLTCVLISLQIALAVGSLAGQLYRRWLASRSRSMV